MKGLPREKNQNIVPKAGLKPFPASLFIAEVKDPMMKR